MREPRKILVEHYEFGPLEVVASPEYKYWTGKSGFWCPDDPELGTFDEDELIFWTRQQKYWNLNAHEN